MDVLSLVVTVQCLDCGSTYSKPAGPGTVRSNPGCPQCGYVGWSSGGETRGELEPLRFVADRQPDRLSHSR